MTFTTFADGASANIDFDWNGVAVSVGLHFEHAAPSAANFTALAAEVAAGFASDLMPNLTDELTMGDVTVQDLSSEGAPKYVNGDENGTTGTLIQDSVPNNTSGLVSHATNDTGRSARGRTYIPGISEADESDGLLTIARRNNILIDWGTFIAGVAVLGWDFVIAQRFSAGVQLTVGVMRLVTSERMKQELGTQRRRQVRSAT